MPSHTVTYSPAYTIVPTYECFNRCTYCNFRVDPGRDDWLSLEQARRILDGLREPRSASEGDQLPPGAIALPPHIPSGSAAFTLEGQGDAEGKSAIAPPIVEILILSGEVHPQSARRPAWFQRIYDLCELALSLGFLPHTNAGPLTFEEMMHLKQVNVSMGLMVEQVTPLLLDTVHRHAPSKAPDLRLQQLDWAGQLQIPFTTGLLLGIGETEADWIQTLRAIAALHQTHHHIQEVILQPHSPGNHQSDAGEPFPAEQLVRAVAIARQELPDDITLQIPPNLVTQPDILLACLQAGARDLGGIGPKDEVNPDYPHPHAIALHHVLHPAGWQLQPRLPLYPQYDEWLSPRMQKTVQTWRSRFFHEGIF